MYGSQYESPLVHRYLQHDIRAGDADLRRYGQMLGYSSNGTSPWRLSPKNASVAFGPRTSPGRACSVRKRWAIGPRLPMPFAERTGPDPLCVAASAQSGA